MDWKEQLLVYQPVNHQEQQDLQQVRRWLASADNLLTRDNEEAHMSATAFVMNENLDEVLMVFHHIYQSYSWTGGHADGEADFYQVALREAREETGITRLTPLTKRIIALDVLPVPAHIKKGKPVKEHMHINVTYLFTAPQDQSLVVKPDENSDVAWIKIAELDQKVTEELMLPVYRKIIDTAHQIQRQQEIVLAGGCFWGLQEAFRRVNGILVSEVGYAQGHIKNPVYAEVCTQTTGHTEVVRLTYDPQVISLEKILEIFFRLIDPTTLNRQGGDVGTNYRTGIYPGNPKDAETVRRFIEGQRANYAVPVVVEAEPLEHFWLAEEYHQDYLVKNPGGYCHIDFQRLKKTELKEW